MHGKLTGRLLLVVWHPKLNSLGCITFYGVSQSQFSARLLSSKEFQAARCLDISTAFSILGKSLMHDMHDTSPL